MSESSPLLAVDDDARRLAGTLLREARYGALATLEPGTNWPMASRVSVCADVDGSVLMPLSQLSAHFPALENDARTSLLLGAPGSGDPLAYARMTVIAQAERLSEPQRERGRFLARHPKATLYIDFADFAFWRLKIERISLNGGFGRAYSLRADDLQSAPTAVCDELAAMEADAIAHMNEDHAEAVQGYATALLQREAGPWQLIGLDPAGLDLALGSQVARLWFDQPLAGAEALRPCLVELAQRARERSALN